MNGLYILLNSSNANVNAATAATAAEQLRAVGSESSLGASVLSEATRAMGIRRWR